MSAQPDRPPTNVVQGVAPPHSLEAEQSVLGAILMSDKTHHPYFLDLGLRPEDFYRERHRLIFEAMLDLYQDSEPIDHVTVAEHLAARGKLDAAGGRGEIDALAMSVPAVGAMRRYAEIVREHSLMRRLLTTTYEIQASVHEHDAPPRELIERAEKAMLEVARDDRQKDFRKVGDVLGEEVGKWETLSREGISLTGTSSGFDDLDEITGGFQAGNLIILAARPAMGKSALVTNIAENVALHPQRPRPVALFSLEMSEAELAQRFIASQASIKGDDLRKGRLRDERKWRRVLEHASRFYEAPLFVDDSSDVGLLEIRAKARRLHQNTYNEYGGLGLIIIDYLQLMRADSRIESRVLQVGEMSRGLKILAKELQVPVIALSQLSRGVESRTDKKPMLSDLRESGCLTGDALVNLPETGRRVPIRELEGRHPFEVLALDPETWRLETRTATNAFCTGTKPVFELTTKLGRKIRATANHRFLTFDGWCRLDELEPGTHLSLPRELPDSGAPSMTGDELALLGHLIGDGSTLPRHAVQYTTRERDLAELVAHLASERFGDAIAPRVAAERSWFQVYLPASQGLARGRRNPIAAWLDELGAFGLHSHEKRVPAAVTECSRSGIATFLRHLWATDGCLWCARDGRAHRVYYATSSRGLADDVAHLLLRLGITARVSVHPQRAGRAQHHVDVSGRDDVLRFLELVGAVGERRQAVAAALRAEVMQRNAVTNRDVIPKVAWRRHVVPAMAEAAVTSRALQQALGTSYCGSTLYRSNLSRERAARVAEIVSSPELAGLAASDVYWDQVASIEPAGEEKVYDLTVEGLHNFVANDIVVHNSIEQDADVVMFIYRDEYYNGEHTERPGEADLIIAKNRQGQAGVEVALSFQHEYPRFMGLQRAE